MTVQGQPRVRRRRRQKSNSALIVALFLLAIVASIFLVASNSVETLRIGIVAALWAAFLGALAVTKYRKEAEADRAKVRDLRMVYEMQLSREVAARRRHELTLESRIRRELDAEVRSDTSQQLAAVHRELSALRGHLEFSLGQEIPGATRASLPPGAPLTRAEAPTDAVAASEPAERTPFASSAESAADDVVEAEFETEYESGAADRKQRTVAEIIEDLKEATLQSDSR
ncbi:DUF6779 domain-containing protein [Hoyosella subflava]|uniref:DUF6779 domain-containing protein n=1 Tax=Hoyosella subflava (strain DSM 45089 / JCM 17490 / NBRC 109087 / DQS3-9A1) TaxID=443218 RepID=F6EGV2_HOYSD|nr:DUF6779 domain-containing protein [Hoyosella subflava]AEF38776.1 hypothetical protein AS9A_0317 [Hoyosella subflava DQS3-9A1]